MAYTNIDDPSAYFQTATYTGNGDSAEDTNAIVNDGNSNLQPDFIWIKRRNYDNGHQLLDSTRGVDKILGSELTSAETTLSGRLASFGTDGFTVQGSSGAFNQEFEPFVAWQWKANGGTTASNTDGSITSTVQANQDAGFSIVTYTGNGSASTIGHGLGVVPAMIIVKCRNAGSTNWTVYHKNSNATPQNYILELNNTNAAADNDRFNDTAPTSSVFSVNAGSSTVNQNSNTYIAYCFAEKQGYSKFGKYVGNGNADGSFVYTGFKPAFVMFKNSNAAFDWTIVDNKREGYNLINKRLTANTPDAEATYNVLDFVSNGFKLRDAYGIWNGSGNTLIYMAFAENPFVTSSGVPTTAR